MCRPATCSSTRTKRRGRRIIAVAPTARRSPRRSPSRWRRLSVGPGNATGNGAAVMADPHLLTTLPTKGPEPESPIAFFEGKLDEARRGPPPVNALLPLFEVGPGPQIPFPAHVG